MISLQANQTNPFEEESGVYERRKGISALMLCDGGIGFRSRENSPA